jgi:hypothetical protein
MTPEHWEEVKNLFCMALNEPAENRLAFLISACNNEPVRAEVRRLLHQHDQAGDFFLAEPAWAKLSSLPLQPFGDAADFRGTPRFAVQQRLGEGTFGIVYRVLDREWNSMVALKCLRQLDAAHLSRFKHEFRSLVDLVHPNLVQLYELFGDERVWFFTMELIEGTDFLAYTRPNNVVQNWDHLRDALVQLASGVQALHSSARLHRDLKPSNVLVSNTGRVLILDFGLVKDLEADSAEQSIALAGSPAYMAPEQVGRGKITAAVDWYAVGVMLYRAITGVLPFQGAWQEVLNRKQAEDPPIPKVLNPDVPDDLNKICHGLLQRIPELRADGVSILDGLRCRTTHPTSNTKDHFVGRWRELQLLGESFCTLESGARQVVLLHGQSGIGKTTLVSEFLRRVLREQPDTVILRGRCHVSESVPYKALDSIADELVRYLRALPVANATALLPRHPALLARLFPVFGELEFLAEFRDRTDSQMDEQEIRRWAFAAISETLGRMTDRHHVVISIDDLQWGDLDSLAFLAELVVPVHAPALMLILTFRSEDADASPPVVLLRTFRHRLTNPESWTEIELAGLAEEDGRELLCRLDGERKLTEGQLQEMIEEAHGSPLFLRELLQVALQDAGLDERRNSAERGGVAEMIRRRANTLSPIARQLFEALSVAAEPLSKGALYRTIMGASDAELSRETRLLIQGNLVRVTGGVNPGRLEPFHDQVREAFLAGLSPSDLKNWHQRLAQALETEEPPDPQKLLRHYLGAGNMTAAFRCGLAAANIAEKALAFDMAASFYREAMETGEADMMDLATLYRQRAEALTKAGRGREAAEDYLSASFWPEYNDSFQMRRLAAEQLLRSGHLDEGVQSFKGLLRDVGFWMPTTPMQSIAAMLAIRAFIRLRGLRWRWHEDDLPALTVRKLDLLWSGAPIFTIVNFVFGGYLQARHLLEALRAGEASHLALSLGLGGTYEAIGGAPYYEKGRKILNSAEHLASDLKNPSISSFISVCWVYLDFLCVRIDDGLEHSRRALRTMHSLGTEHSWEASTAKLGFIWLLAWGGRVRELSELVPTILDEARSRGDIYTFVVIRCNMSHLADLAADNPDRALREISEALGQWSQARYDCHHFGAAFAAVECELYAGRIDHARNRVLSEWPAMKRSLLFRKCQTFRILLFYMRARTALATWMQQRDDRTLVREIKHYATLLTNARSPWGTALGHTLRSSVEAGRGQVREAILLLDRAEATFRQQDFRLLAAAISRRRGELEGEAGVGRVQAADAFMRSENIVRPDRMTFMILPG